MDPTNLKVEKEQTFRQQTARLNNSTVSERLILSDKVKERLRARQNSSHNTKAPLQLRIAGADERNVRFDKKRKLVCMVQICLLKQGRCDGVLVLRTKYD